MGSGISSLSAVMQEGSTSRDSNRNERLCNGCEICLVVFSTFKRKHQCYQCTKYFCSNCSLKHRNSVSRGDRCCLRCHVINGNHIDESRLMLLKVKDLKKFLVTNKIPTTTSQTKIELARLVVSHLQELPHDISRTASWDGLERSTSTNNRGVFATSTISENNLSNQTRNSGNSPSNTNEAHSQDRNNDTQGLFANDTARSNFNRNANKLSTTDEDETKDTKRRISLTDIANEEDIQQLSVKQLKQILITNFVNYKGCVEKWELTERVRRLYNTRVNANVKGDTPDNDLNQGGNKNSDSYDTDLCKICMDAPITCVLLECGHMVTCTKCGKRLAECPICRQYVVRAVHIFKA